MSNEKIMSDIAGLERKRAYLVEFATSIATVLETQNPTDESGHCNGLKNSDLQTINELLEQIDECMREIVVYAGYLNYPVPLSMCVRANC